VKTALYIYNYLYGYYVVDSQTVIFSIQIIIAGNIQFHFYLKVNAYWHSHLCQHINFISE